MRLHRQLVATTLLLVASAPSWALDGEYYTYNGLQETVDAFKRLALIFSDPGYISLFGLAAVAGIVLSIVAATGKGLMGGKANLFSWVAPVLIGTAVFSGMIVPKGDLYIYDKVKNSFETVADVPDGIIIVATIANKVQRLAVNIIDNNVADPRMQYALGAGGISFSLLSKATAEFTDVADSYLTRSIERYWKDCGVDALMLDASGLTENELRRDTENLVDTFEKMDLEAQTTQFYSDATKWGEVKTCKAAWAEIKPLLNDADTWDMPIRQVCGKAGFNVGKIVPGVGGAPGVAVELQNCKALLADFNKMHGLNPVSAESYLRNAYLAKVVLNASMDGGMDATQSMLANRSMMTQSIGTFQTVNEWMPRVRAWVMAVMLGLIPIVGVFLVTPLFFRAVGLVLGLFVWYTTWGIADAMLYRSAVDAGLAAFFQIQDYKLGLDAIWLVPEATVKALGVFGQAQMAALGISGLIVGALFKVTAGSALGSMAGGALSQAKGAGSQSATTASTPDGQAGLISSATRGLATVANYQHSGFQRMVQGETGGMASTMGHNNALMAPSGVGGAYNAGANTGGEATGRTAAIATRLREEGKPLTPENIATKSAEFAEVEKLRGMGDTLAYRAGLARLYNDARIVQDKDKFLEASTLFSATNNWDAITRTQAIGDKMELLSDKYAQSHGGTPPNEKQLIHALGTLQYGPEFAKIEAFGGDTRAWMEAQVFAEKKGFNMTTGEMVAYEKAGITPTEIFQGVGAMQTMQTLGTQQAFSKIGGKAFIVAAKMDAARHAGTANAWEDYVQQKFQGDFKKAEFEVGQSRAGADFANYFSLKTMAKEFTNGNILDAQINQGLTNVRMTVGQEEARKFGKRHHFNDEQMNIIKNSPEGVEMNLSMTQNGAVANVSAYSGTRVETSDSSSTDTGNKVTTGWDMRGAVQGMLYGTHGQDIAQLKNRIPEVDRNMDARMELMAGAASTFDSIIDARANRGSDVSTQAGISFDSKSTVIGGLIGKVTGTGGNIGVSTNESWSDMANWNANRIMTEVAYPEIQKHARDVVAGMESRGEITGAAAKEDMYATVMANKLRTFAAIVNEEHIRDGKAAVEDGIDIPLVGRVGESRIEAVGIKATRGAT